MRGVLEPRDIQNEDKVPAAMIAAYWAEVSVSGLLEAPARVADHHMLLSTRADIQDLLPELSLGESAMAHHVDLSTIAPGETGSLRHDIRLQPASKMSMADRWDWTR